MEYCERLLNLCKIHNWWLNKYKNCNIISRVSPLQAINFCSLFSKNILIEDYSFHCHYHQQVLVVLRNCHLVLLQVLVHFLEVLELQQLDLVVYHQLHRMVLLDILDLMGLLDKNFHLYQLMACCLLLHLLLHHHFHQLQQYQEQLTILKVQINKL